MRKITATILSLTFLFNLFGYRFVVDFMLHKANTQLEARLDKNQYDEAQLLELKIPINLPYLTSWAGYQRCDGEIQLNGILYHYVKRKVANDTLYLKCIPNVTKMDVETVKDNYVKGALDLNQNDNSKKSDNSKTISFKNFQGDYDEYSFSISLNKAENSGSKCWMPLKSKALLSSPHVSPEQPPDDLSI